jgi:hypothetical protein
MSPQQQTALSYPRAPSAVGDPDSAENPKARPVEAGRVLISLVEQVVDATEHSGVVGGRVAMPNAEPGEALLRMPGC